VEFEEHEEAESFLYHLSDFVMSLAGDCALIQAIMRLLPNARHLDIAV